jgi:hypothetical protein
MSSNILKAEYEILIFTIRGKKVMIDPIMQYSFY